MNNAKNPAARPGFALSGTKSDEIFDSVFGDDRDRRRQHVESVAEADLHLVLVDRTIRVDERAGQDGRHGKPSSEEPRAPNMAEIGIAVFGKDRPIVGHGILEAAANRPADAGARNAACLLYTSPSPRDSTSSRIPSSA